MGNPGPTNQTDYTPQRPINPYGERDYPPFPSLNEGGGVVPAGYDPPYFCPYGPSSGSRAVVVMRFDGAFGSVADGNLLTVNYGNKSLQSFTVEADVSSNGAAAAISFAGAPASAVDLLNKIAAAVNPVSVLGGIRLGVIADVGGSGKPGLVMTDTDFDFDSGMIHLDGSTGELAAAKWTITQVSQGYDPASAEPAVLGKLLCFVPGPETSTC